MKAPLTVQVEITDKCNLRCPHCYRLNVDKPVRSSDFSDEQVFSFVIPIMQKEVFSVVLTGGEPLIREKLVVRMVKALKEAKIDVSVNTNLLLFTPAVAESFVKAGVDALLVSCCSTDPTVYQQMTNGGRIEVFKRHLGFLIKSGMKFSVNMVVSKANLSCIRQTATDLALWGVESFGATPMGANLLCPKPELMISLDEFQNGLLADLVWANEQLGLKVDIFEALPKCAFPKWIRYEKFAFLGRRCQAGRNTCSITNTGEIKPCVHNTRSYGNLLQNDFGEIWERMSADYQIVPLPDKCRSCRVLSACGGGCRITALAVSGRADGQDWLMDQPANPIKHDPKPVLILEPNMRFEVDPDLRWRKEDEGFLITTKKFHQNIMIASRDLFEFLQGFLGKQPIELWQIAKSCGTEFADPEFQKVIGNLVATEFAIITKGGEKKERVA